MTGHVSSRIADALRPLSSAVVATARQVSRRRLVLAGAVFAMFLLGLLATWIPARRALSIDPLVLLREE